MTSLRDVVKAREVHEAERRRRLLGPSLTVRLPDELHARVVRAARAHRLSLNQLVIVALESALSEEGSN